MSQLRLREISGSAFCSFVEPFRLQLPKTGMVLIKGVNRDTGDTSDAGKSSLILAIQHLLGCAPAPYHGTRLQSWLTEEQVRVEGILESPQGVVEIVRSDRLQVTVGGGKPTKGKAAEAALDQVIGIDRKLLRDMTYRAQRTRGVVLSLGDPEKKALLGKLLGVEPYERVAKEALIEAAAAEAVYGRALVSLQAAQERLHEAIRARGGAGIPDNTASARLSEAERVYEAARTAVRTAESDLKLVQSVQADAERKVQADAERTQTGVEEATEQLRKVRELLQRCRAAESRARMEHAERRAVLTASVRIGQGAARELPVLLAEVASVQKQLLVLQNHVCPTCERQWPTSACGKRVDEFRERLAGLEKRVSDSRLSVEHGEASSSFLADLGDYTPPPLLRQVEDQEAALLQAQRTASAEAARKTYEAMAAVRARFAGNVAEMTQKLEAVRLHEQAAGMTCGAERTAVAVAVAQAQALDRLQDAERLAGEAVVTQEQAVKEAEANWNSLRDLHALVGPKGFLGLIFDEALVEWASETNEILSRVANVRHLTFGFRSERETAAGTTDRRITPFIVKGGVEVPVDSGISGGMSSAVELAVDMAFRTVVQRRRGVYPGWLILDEAFDGLGPVSKETCFEMLQSVAKDWLVLVIDHDTSFQGLFGQVITVESSHGQSRITSMH